MTRHTDTPGRSVEETEDLATDMLGTSLVVVHDTLVGGEHENTELTGRKDSVGEVLELSEGQIETGRDDTALVEATVEVHNDLAIAGIIDDLEIVDVAVSLHDLEELDEHLRDGAEDNLNSVYDVRYHSWRAKQTTRSRPAKAQTRRVVLSEKSIPESQQVSHAAV